VSFEGLAAGGESCVGFVPPVDQSGNRINLGTSETVQRHGTIRPHRDALDPREAGEGICEYWNCRGSGDH
jgi:hypothetical protein